MKFQFLFILVAGLLGLPSQNAKPIHIPEADLILGKWISARKDIVVEVSRNGRDYKAVILWFDDRDDPSRPMNLRTDYQNPDPKLKNRRLLGLEILRNMEYNSNTHQWEKGIIYDPDSGREWSSYAWMDEKGILKVKGFWHFKFIGKSLEFTRLTAKAAENIQNFKPPSEKKP